MTGSKLIELTFFVLHPVSTFLLITSVVEVDVCAQGLRRQKRSGWSGWSGREMLMRCSVSHSAVRYLHDKRPVAATSTRK
jgi:hypothetical protein